MPVIASDPHTLTIRDGTEPYGCKDKQSHDGYWARDRDNQPAGNFIDVQVFIKNTASTECRYDHSLTDPRCNACLHRGSGEAYSEGIKANGV